VIYLETLYSERFDILSSGSVMQFKDEPISFKLNDHHRNPSEEITLHFRFASDAAGVPRIDFDQISNHEANYVLNNFENGMGSLDDRPLEIGEINDKLFYLVFAITRTHPKVPIIMHYTWYLEKEKRTNA
jgi:hypothetical protein